MHCCMLLTTFRSDTLQQRAAKADLQIRMKEVDMVKVPCSKGAAEKSFHSIWHPLIR